jgi:hypothetical protein
MSDPIKRIVLKDGRVRWRFVIDLGRRPDGRRDQRTYTHNSKKTAQAHRAKLIADRAQGTLVRPNTVTFAEAADTWLAGKRRLRPGTRRAYRDALDRATDRIGHLPVQGITKAHLDRLVNELLSTGKKVNNRKTLQLSGNSVG